jgi:prepilin-type N-terminal cleavage/methylation domain-containing protein
VNVGNNSGSRNRGFSLLEMVAVIAIIMTVTAICVTTINTAIRTGHIRRSANRYVELQQTARTRAAADDRYYSVYILPAAGAVPQRAYVDIYPQQANGASGHGAPPAGFYEAGPPSDPVVTISNDVAVQPVGAAPNTADLKNRFCANCATAIIFNQWPTWGPDGMPCVAQLSSDGSTTVCNSAGGPRAYWTFFQSQATSEWAAVTITPAGRVRAWTYGANSSTWAPQ